MVILYSLVLSLLTIYSYALIDPNITFINHPLWSRFLEQMLQLGYYQRAYSWYIYLFIVVALSLFYVYFSRHYQRYSPIKLALVIGIILLLAYPFLSHDLLSYMFDAKIFTSYHKNPYLFKPSDFYGDQWLRFTQWTHRSYPYGPVFLLLSFIPSFISMGKFFAAFILFKMLFVIFYLISVVYLNRLNKRWAILMATHPLVLIEGLVNTHNDLIGLSLAVVAIYYLFTRKEIFGRIWLLLSVGIKFLTLPLLIVTKKTGWLNLISFIGMCTVIIYLSLTSEIQPWYFLTLLVFIPFYEKLLFQFNLFFIGLLMSYYPYIRLGGWDKPEYIFYKHYIIEFFLLLNLVMVAFVWIRKKQLVKFSQKS